MTLKIFSILHFFIAGHYLKTIWTIQNWVLFSKEDLKSSDSDKYVDILMTQDEWEIEKQREKEEHEKNGDYEDSIDRDPDSWMDNPDDYWNID
jgi:hypothetical protein